MQRCLSPMPVFDAGAGREEKAAQEKRDDMRSRQNSAVVRQIVVDKIQKTNDDSRRIWNAAVCHELGVPDTYEKVAVLLVHWDGPFDRDGECAGETAKLGKVFRELYGFETKTVLLKCHSRKPENQLNRDITDFIHDHDGHYRNTLLVVYYSGHGDTTASGDFYIAGREDDKNGNEGTKKAYVPIASWKNVDNCLQTADADVLTIMDCCYATEVGKGGGDNSRTFETLAATDTVTSLPGKKSYTNALIAVLEESFGHEHGKSRVFDTNYLHDRICKSLNSNRPRLINRINSTVVRHVQLTPLAQFVEPKPANTPRVDLCASSLRVQIDFARHKSLTEEQVDLLAQKMARGAREADLGITGVSWLQFMPKTHDLPSMYDVFQATRLLQSAMHRRMRRLIKRPRIGQADRESRKRKRTDDECQARLALTPPASIRGHTPAG